METNFSESTFRSSVVEMSIPRMVSPKAMVVLLAVISFSEAGTLFDGNMWNDFRVRWSLLGPAKGFYSMPRTAKDARDKDYVTPPEEIASCGTNLEVLCPPADPSVCILYDNQGNIAGMEIGVLRTDVDNKGYPYDKRSMFRKTKRFDRDIYLTSLFFVDQGVINTGGRASMKANGTGTGLWMQDGPDRSTLFEVPRYEKDIGKTLYTKENCVPAMGVHYYYNISASLQCEDFHPIFGLYKRGELIGFGYQIFGKITPVDTEWFENVPAVAVKPTIPNAPDCLVERVKTYGVVSLHVYFVDNPWLINCIF